MSGEFLLSIFAVVAPAGAAAWWFRRRFDPPRGWLWTLAVIGAVAILFSQPQFTWELWKPCAQFLFHREITRDTYPLLYPCIEAFVAAAIPEELCKFAVLLLVGCLPGALGGARNGALWGAFVGIGHAVGENVQDLAEGPVSALVGGNLKLLFTTALGLIMGHVLNASRATGSRAAFAAAILAPVVLHGLFNFGLFVGQDVGLPYLEREELPPWPVAAGMLAMPAALLTTMIGGAWIVRRLW